MANSIQRLPATTPDSQILRAISGRQYPTKSATSYAVETEPRVRAIVTRLDNTPRYSRPPQQPGRVILYVSHHSADVELREEPLIKELIAAEPDVEFYALDVRGIGDSRPDTCGVNTYLSPYGSDYFYAAHSLMLGRSIPTLRAFDVLRVIDWFNALGRREIHLAALGWGTIPATLAAVMSEDVKQLTLKHALTSWSSVAEAERYKWPLSSFVPGVLKSFDLPDCYRALATKNLKQLEPWGAVHS